MWLWRESIIKLTCSCPEGSISVWHGKYNHDYATAQFDPVFPPKSRMLAEPGSPEDRDRGPYRANTARVGRKRWEAFSMGKEESLLFWTLWWTLYFKKQKETKNLLQMVRNVLFKGSSLLSGTRSPWDTQKRIKNNNNLSDTKKKAGTKTLLSHI